MSRDAYGPPVANRPTNHTPCVASGTYFQGEDLGRIQPRHGQPCRSENSSEEEDEEDGAAAHAGGVPTTVSSVDRSASEATGAEHANALADGSPVEGPATTDSIESEDTDEGGEHVCDVVETGYPKTVVRRDAGDCEDGGPVNGDAGDTDPFLENLEPDDQLDPATGV